MKMISISLLLCLVMLSGCSRNNQKALGTYEEELAALEQLEQKRDILWSQYTKNLGTLMKANKNKSGDRQLDELDELTAKYKQNSGPICEALLLQRARTARAKKVFTKSS